MTAGGDALDPRLTPARPHVAASFLRGRVDAERFTEGRQAFVATGLLDLKGQPRADAGLSTQLLHGEAVTVYDDSEGWSFVQAELDGYVGYVLTEGLALDPATLAPASHRVTVRATFVYPAADMKRPVRGVLPMDARVAVAEPTGAFARLAGGGFVWAAHLAPLQEKAGFVETAEMLIGTPYLWGGKSGAGIDCSGLVQLAASVAGIATPRDTDMQEAMPGWQAVGLGEPRCRGDLVFWPGHVGIMCDVETLLHANGHHMLVIREPAAAAESRIAAAGHGVRGVRRLFRNAIAS